MAWGRKKRVKGRSEEEREDGVRGVREGGMMGKSERKVRRGRSEGG